MARILPLTVALTLAHTLLVASCAGAHLGIARAAREEPNRSPTSLRIVTAIGDALMFPTSLVWWLWRGERFPDHGVAVLFTSPLWGFALAYVAQRRNPGNHRL